LAALYAVDANGARPPCVSAMVTLGLVLEAVTVTWAWWADRHRDVAGVPHGGAPSY